MKEKRRRIRRKNMGYKKLILLFVIIFILILLITKVIFPATVSLSRYVYSVVKSFYLNSKEFYFTSNRLAKKIDEAHFESSNWSGSSDYRVDVEMYSKKNALKKVVSDMDITYKLKIDVGVYKYSVNSQNKVEYKELEYFENATEDINSNYINLDIEKLSGIIYAQNDNQDSFYINIIPKDNAGFTDKDYVYIKVTADATEPYKETLYGEFYIYVGKQGLSYQIDDSPNSPYLNVVITNATEDYIVDTAFGGYNVGDNIKAETYRELLINNPDIANYCHSMYVNLIFDPEEVVLDTTSNVYIIAEKNANWITTKEIDKGNSNYTYVQSVKVEIEALESQVVKFYKLKVQNDYTYPNEANKSIVTVESV